MRWPATLADLATEFGCTISPTKGGHVRFQHPSGWFVFVSSTPSDWRTRRNLRAQLRRQARSHTTSLATGKTDVHDDDQGEGDL